MQRYTAEIPHSWRSLFSTGSLKQGQSKRVGEDPRPSLGPNGILPPAPAQNRISKCFLVFVGMKNIYFMEYPLPASSARDDN